jgi:tetratricopeptide (TPR) repeat protein
VTVVDLHPEELFDALRVGSLTSSDRIRLEAHCARCAACQFELGWLDTNVNPAELTVEDLAHAEAGLDRLLRAAEQGNGLQRQRAPRHLPLRWAAGGALLGTILTVALFSARELWTRHEYSRSASEHTSSRQVAREVASPKMPEVPTAEPIRVPPVSPPSTARPPTANALLAAARRARTQDESSRARRLYQQVIETYPSTAAAGAARVALGRLIYDESGSPHSALTLFDAYLNQSPNGSLAEEALYYRALSLDRIGRTRQAQECLRLLLKRFPQSVYAAPARSRTARHAVE